MPSPLAYFLTWTCYGTWLPGDARGSVEWTPDIAKRLAPNEKKVDHWSRRLKHAPVILSDAMRSCVGESIEEAADYHGWTIHAVNPRTTHIHIVVSAPITPEETMRRFKARATRSLRERGLIDPARTVWTRHGSTLYLWDEAAVREKAHYVLHGQ